MLAAVKSVLCRHLHCGLHHNIVAYTITVHKRSVKCINASPVRIAAPSRLAQNMVEHGKCALLCVL